MEDTNETPLFCAMFREKPDGKWGPSGLAADTSLDRVREGARYMQVECEDYYQDIEYAVFEIPAGTLKRLEGEG